ncbi:hypothetical protein [Methylomonas sp. AM2-LC]|uniref:hypothetical protein n=1 Tax=Methylomonas sp. AM2-LC TaxID=3153301 RepID=UPI00326504F6
MNEFVSKSVSVPKTSLYRWEIGVALIIKVIFLTGLWFLIFRWPDKPVHKPDIAVHFMQSNSQPQVDPDFSSQSKKETHHDR